MSRFSRIYRILLIVGISTFGIALAAYALGGSYSRYLADDYCYGVEIHRQGFFGAQVHSYLNLMPYASNRFSLTFFAGLLEILGGPKAMPFFPALAILLWVGGWIYAAGQWASLKAYSLSFTERVFIGVGIVFFALYLAPNRYQVLDWGSGMLTYLAPLMIGTFLLGWAADMVRKQSLSLARGIGLGFASWVAVGFSETVAALQAAAWLLAVGAAVLGVARRNPPSRKTWGVVLIGLTGALLGMTVLLLCPGNSLRQVNFPPPPDLLTLLNVCVHNSVLFLYRTLRGSPLPYAVLVGLAFSLAWLHRQKQPGTEPRAISLKRIIRLALLPAVVFLLLMAIMAPQAWAMSTYPEERGLVTGVVVLIAAAGLGAWWAGELAFDLLRSGRARWASLAAGVFLLGMGAAVLYPLRPVAGILAEDRALSVRAAAWDARDQLIHLYKERGVADPVVPALDSVAQIFELQFKPDHWVNNCAADYYGLDSIRVIEP